MDKSAESVTEIFKSIFAVTPTGAVLFLVAVALAVWAWFREKRIVQLQDALLAKEERFRVEKDLALKEQQILYNEKISSKEKDLAIVQERQIEHDNTTADVLISIRDAIKAVNHKRTIGAVYNGVQALGEEAGIPSSRMNMNLLNDNSSD